MSALEKMKTSMGIWQGSSRLHDPHTGAPEDSLSTLSLTPTEGEAVLRLDYTWAYQGAPQQGTVLLAEAANQEVSASWTDTWHMGDQTMHCKGTTTSDGSLSLLGSYAAPPGPDWGWRVVIRAGRDIQIAMYNITPEGQEEIAVEAVYRHIP